MAQTGYTPISLYYSATGGAAPTSGNLVAGELAINTADGKLFYKDSAGVVQTIASKDTFNGIFSTISVAGNSYLATASGAVGIGTTSPGYSLDIQTTLANLRLKPSTATNSAYVDFNNTGGSFYVGKENSVGGTFSLTAYSSVIMSTGAYPLITGTNNTERMRILSSGEVCIGTTTTASGSQLTVSGAATINNTVISAASIELNSLGTGNRNAYIDFHSDDTYTDYGLRIIKGSGANGEATITKRGTGAFNLLNEDASPMLFWTSGAERMRIDNSGNVGIGTNSPSTKLHVVGVITATQGVTGTPVFSCYPALDTTISSATQTVIANNTEEYDLGGCYNNTGSTVTLNGISVPAYSFAPNVAGYYSFNMTVNTELSVNPTRCFAIIAKNGIGNRISENQTAATGVFGGPIIYYLNGTGDYVNAQIWLSATTPKYSGGFASTRFQGTLIRAA
jgi:hypothetical protein